MKKALSFCLLLCGTLFSIYSDAKTNEQSLDQIVAIVNEDVVTKSEYNRSLSTIKMQIAQEHASAPAENVLQKQVLDQLINRKLQLQVAKQAGIKVTDNDIDQAVDRVAKQNNMTVSELYQHINQEGMPTTDYRNEIRDQMTLQRLQQQEVINKVSVSPTEVANFMKSQAWQNNGAKEYHLEDILIPFSDTPSSDEIAKAKKHAQVVITKIHQGENFQAAAKAEASEHSAQGGDLGWRKLAEMPSVFADQVIHMQTNEISEPIQAPNGFHILRLVASRSVDAQSAPSRKQIESMLLQRKFEEAVQSWVSRLRSQAFVQVNQLS